jgi:hypothetical protein
MLTPYFTDPGYLRVGGKPMLTVFDPGDAGIPYSYIQSKAVAAGLPGVSLAGPTGGAPDKYKNVVRYNSIPGWGVGEEEHAYLDLTGYQEGTVWYNPVSWEAAAAAIVPGQQCFIPTIMAGWDPRPWDSPPSWYFNNPTYIVGGQNRGRTPANFGSHLQNAINFNNAHANKATAENLVMVYAWNEYGEGGYIAPTLGDPNRRHDLEHRPRAEHLETQ